MPTSLLKNLKVPTLYSSWQCCCGPPAGSPPRRRSTRDPRFTSTRTYADVKSTRGFEFRDDMDWPCRKGVAWTPSPYEIFDLRKNAVYTKRRFYDLVKLYHPDRNGIDGSPSESISHVERLERYRLVVQAHEILSDPVKRRAYDASGAGWGASARTADRHSKGYTNAEGKRYGFGPDDDASIFQNATWEDWERWYRRHDNPNKQAYSGIYMHPNAFASFVIILAVLSGVYQATRAGQYSGTFEEKAKAVTAETHRFLSTRAGQYQENGPAPDGRVKHFLEKRDPSKYGLKDEEEVAYKKHFASNGTMQPAPQLKAPDDG